MIATAHVPVQTMAYDAGYDPKQILKDFLGIDMANFTVDFKRPSLTLNEIDKVGVTDIAPLMKFVSRQNAANQVYQQLDIYLHWKMKRIGEFEKKVQFITVVGTSGKGKTTFCRRFLDLQYNGRFQDIVNECKESNRRYRVSCEAFDCSKDPETQLSLMVLFEAFKYSGVTVDLFKFLADYFGSNNRKVSLHSVLELVTQTFFKDHGTDASKRLVIINLDETNSLLNNDTSKYHLKELMRVLRRASCSCVLLPMLSGTHSVDLLNEIQISNSAYLNVDLPLIPLEDAKEVVLGMTAKTFEISTYLEYVLTLCGGVGRYIEILIMKMSMLGDTSEKSGSAITFKRDAFETFLANKQTSYDAETLLQKVTFGVSQRYQNVFQTFVNYIELIACYTIFQWPVSRGTMINGVSVGYLESKGLVFLQPRNDSTTYCCEIPFITLYWVKNFSASHPIEISFLTEIKRYHSSDEQENNTLHIMMLKLWGLIHKKKLIKDANGLYAVQLSDLVLLRDAQNDVAIKFRPLFTVQSSNHQILKKNYNDMYDRTDCIAFLNAKGASFVDALIYSQPIIGIQEKQRIVARKSSASGNRLKSVSNSVFQEERAKFVDDGIFMFFTDETQGNDVQLGDRDVFIDSERFIPFAGPLIALRRAFALNSLNQHAAKRQKLG